MFPFRDENPTRRFPALTVLLIAANVLVWLYQERLPPAQQADFIYARAAIPLELTTGQDVTVPGAPGLGLHRGPLWLTLFTSMFMHAGLLHLGGNMLYLWIFGNNVEDLLGRLRFLAFYLMCGLFSMGAQVLSSPHSRVPTLGASGAIAGVLGGYLVKFPGARVHTLLLLFPFVQVVPIPAVFVLGLWFIGQLLSAMVAPGGGGGIAFVAHVVGFVAGLVLVRLFTPKARRRYRW